MPEKEGPITLTSAIVTVNEMKINIALYFCKELLAPNELFKKLC